MCPFCLMRQIKYMALYGRIRTGSDWWFSKVLQIRTGSDSTFADQDWTRTEKFHSSLISVSLLSSPLTFAGAFLTSSAVDWRSAVWRWRHLPLAQRHDHRSVVRRLSTLSQVKLGCMAIICLSAFDQRCIIDRDKTVKNKPIKRKFNIKTPCFSHVSTFWHVSSSFFCVDLEVPFLCVRKKSQSSPQFGRDSLFRFPSSAGRGIRTRTAPSPCTTPAPPPPSCWWRWSISWPCSLPRTASRSITWSPLRRRRHGNSSARSSRRSWASIACARSPWTRSPPLCSPCTWVNATLFKEVLK